MWAPAQSYCCKERGDSLGSLMGFLSQSHLLGLTNININIINKRIERSQKESKGTLPTGVKNFFFLKRKKIIYFLFSPKRELEVKTNGYVVSFWVIKKILEFVMMVAQ